MPRPWEPKRADPSTNDGCPVYACFMTKEHLLCKIAHLEKVIADMRAASVKAQNIKTAPLKTLAAPIFGARA